MIEEVPKRLAQFRQALLRTLFAVGDLIEHGDIEPCRRVRKMPAEALQLSPEYEREDMVLVLQAATYAGLLTRRDQPRAHAGIFRAVRKLSFGGEFHSLRAPSIAGSDIDDEGADVASDLKIEKGECMG